MGSGDTAPLSRDAAIAILRERARTDDVATCVETALMAVRVETATGEEVRATLALIGEYVTDAHRTLIDAARNQHRLRWWEIGELLGFPPRTAAQRAYAWGRRVGAQSDPRPPTDQ